MKSNLIKLSKKKYEVEIGGKKMYQFAGAYYCKKCGYQMTPRVLKGKRGFFNKVDIYLDVSCLCDKHK